MGELQPLGRMLLVFGLLLAAVGLVLTFAGKVPWLGRLPGDIVVERPSFRLYLPLATSVLISLLLTGILWLLRR
jgi:hypothetical protein